MKNRKKNAEYLGTLLGWFINRNKNY